MSFLLLQQAADAAAQAAAQAYRTNFQFLTYGLIAAWLVLIVYVVVLSGRERKLQRELDRLRLMVEDKERERK